MMAASSLVIHAASSRVPAAPLSPARVISVSLASIMLRHVCTQVAISNRRSPSSTVDRVCIALFLSSADCDLPPVPTFDVGHTNCRGWMQGLRWARHMGSLGGSGLTGRVTGG